MPETMATFWNTSDDAERALRPTTKDLASHLGLSRSTVDRVLNGRPGVKAKTVKAVHQAIEELGFERNISAANLARRRVYRFAFLLPRAEGDFLSELEHQILDLRRHMASENIDIIVYAIAIVIGVDVVA